MKHSHKPRKKKNHGWKPLAYGFLAVAGVGLLSWYGYRTWYARPLEADPAPPSRQQEPTPPAPEAAKNQEQERPQAFRPRQPIFDRNMSPLAVSFKQVSVYLRPVELQAEQKAVAHLAELLGLVAEKLEAELRTERRFLWLKRNISSETVRKIKDFNFSGVYLVDELQRYYPFHAHAAHTVGFMKDEQGLAGAEFAYDTILKGDRTLARQYVNLSGIDSAEIPESGAGVVLSIDIDLQIALEKKLQQLLQQTSGHSASAVIIEGDNGEVLAMANVPDYNPNLYWLASGAAHQNKVMSEQVPVAGLNAFFLAAAELAAGNVPPEMAGREAEAELVITPRAVKVVKGDVAAPTEPESQVWHPGIHLSPPFQWPLGFTQHAEKLAGYCGRIGLQSQGAGLADTPLGGEGRAAGKDELCQLENDAWSTSPLALVAAFTQLINGGQRLQPHLLRGIWRLDNSTYHPASFPASEGVGATVSAQFVSFVEGLLPPGPGDALVVEAIRSQGGKVAEAVSGAVVKDETQADLSLDSLLRFSSMALAAGRHDKHQLALVLMVDGARFNLALASPVRKAASEILSQSQGIMAKRWENEITPPQLDSDALLYQKWSLSQSLDAPPPVARSTVTLEMPDVTGMSLRKAMQSLQGYNLKVSIQGAGRVMRQSPAAGVLLKGVDEAKLELRIDQ